MTDTRDTSGTGAAPEGAVRMPERFMDGTRSSRCIGEIVKGYAGVRDTPLREGERRLGGWILPPFQRGAVWTREQQISLVESIWLELPIGSLVWNVLYRGGADQPCDGWLLDGQQRVTAIFAYMADEFPVFGAKFSELHRTDFRRWGFSIPIACIETSISDPAMCREIYNRLAYGRTAHERERGE